jgi:hypothetical protein
MSNMSDINKERVIDPHVAVDHIFKYAAPYAKAKATRIYLEEFRKSKKALLMSKSIESTIGGQERDAYSHQEYQDLLKNIEVAVEEEEKYRWELIAAQARIDVWRTQQANARMEGRVTL